MLKKKNLNLEKQMENRQESDFKGTLYGVVSSNISKAGWEWDVQNKIGVVRIEFLSGKIYDYWPVHKSTWNEFWQKTPANRSAWLRSNIINNISLNYEHVNDEQTKLL